MSFGGTGSSFGFGAAPAAGAGFGQTGSAAFGATGGFGAAQATGAPAAFGATPQQPAQFAATAPAPGFGFASPVPTQGGFGATTGGFGAPATGGFGATTGGFGATTGGFGATTGGFGAAAAATTGGFGTTAGAGFNYGQQQQQQGQGGQALTPGGPSAPPCQPFETALPTPDTIQSLAFAPQSNTLVSGCWNGSVLVHQVQLQQKPVAQEVATMQHGAPVLGVAWAADGRHVLSCGAQGKVKVWDASTRQQVQELTGHASGVAHVRVDAGGRVWTGGWDNSVKVWDLRTPTAQGTVQLTAAVHAMDVSGTMLVAADAQPRVKIFDTRNPARSLADDDRLKHQVTAVAVQPNSDTYVAGGVEARMHVRALSAPSGDKARNYVFRNPRHRDTAYPITCLEWHPTMTTSFLTAGSDGILDVWEGKYKRDVTTTSDNPCPLPITTTAFSKDGSMLAYALGYDWFRGASCAGIDKRAFIVIRPVVNPTTRVNMVVYRG